MAEEVGHMQCKRQRCSPLATAVPHVIAAEPASPPTRAPAFAAGPAPRRGRPADVCCSEGQNQLIVKEANRLFGYMEKAGMPLYRAMLREIVTTGLKEQVLFELNITDMEHVEAVHNVCRQWVIHQQLARAGQPVARDLWGPAALAPPSNRLRRIAPPGRQGRSTEADGVTSALRS